MAQIPGFIINFTNGCDLLSSMGQGYDRVDKNRSESREWQGLSGVKKGPWERGNTNLHRDTGNFGQSGAYSGLWALNGRTWPHDVMFGCLTEGGFCNGTIP
ncbi:hypothetical protein GKA01_05530 [Gluconobacter kanchanaburiensis NBRC 103587]|uniref:Uncharacterized protein n=1 Tax=Gluconobacter kanchanaburiensis NBRC 103587 TaxID=1307948 RepID=A0A511B4J8_9PROT|nr:hypothetical protein AA103587_0206 [Gluconobacter kanchanaburiensis NBRC 103587]GEK95356.1 hypothetical protein GKA01_05530 [Gluconobacter kanchanaburiensis NBRC 103587]